MELKDLKKGDEVLFVSWERSSSKPAKIHTKNVTVVREPELLAPHNRFIGGMFGAVNGEWLCKAWNFHGFGTWDFRNFNFGDTLPNLYQDKCTHKIFRVTDIKQAELFAKNEVPKLQMIEVVKAVNKAQKVFQNKLNQVAELEKLCKV